MNNSQDHIPVLHIPVPVDKATARKVISAIRQHTDIAQGRLPSAVDVILESDEDNRTKPVRVPAHASEKIIRELLPQLAR